MDDERLGFEDDLMLGVPARGGRAVLQAISSHLAQRTRIPASAILDGLLDREALGSTGFGQGFALPHAFIPGLVTPAKVLVTLLEPIDFKAPDDEPVDIFLAVIWPNGQHEGFLQYLSKLCGVFRSKKLLVALRGVRSEAEALIAISADACPSAPSAQSSVATAFGPLVR
ncbi:MAG TPA: PTS sugar transporter subunit IIA [Ensifer sp.]|jgi:PTS system nitrogen regulatory IIA component|uniref:PTS sugar transporter subunit IIA n=1 Tax=Ensifer sp. TaxID=1872086 RepID=UPI002E0E32FD|nr:PTS sugar transporter subunit IIA [Ensifer sp.]